VSTINLKELSLEELESFVASMGEPKYRAGQIFTWLYSRRMTSFDEMTNLSQPLRQKLSETAIIGQLAVADQHQSTSDGTIKFLFQLADGLKIESVLIPPRRSSVDAETRLTLCVSTQVGCPLDCKFCATGTMGYTRNLTVGEIIDQVLQAQSFSKKPITNIVYMGMGEPMLNYDNVMASVDILSKGIGISPRRITISTAGYVDQIRRMADEGRKPKLALSLHSLDNTARLKLMPITKKHTVEELLDALEYYFKKTKKSVMLEYILFEDINDSDSDVQKIVKASRRFQCRVNLIPFHPINFVHSDKSSVHGLRPASRERILRFSEKLRQSNVPVFIRDSAGEDIEAACGQLAVKNSTMNPLHPTLTA
jgi:23S rRNA (adenine2503-C2)-methyltransferase